MVGHVAAEVSVADGARHRQAAVDAPGAEQLDHGAAGSLRGVGEERRGWEEWEEEWEEE